MTSGRKAVIGLGANLGDAQKTVRLAFDEIAALAEVVEIARSSLYRTLPVGGPPQADYINAAIAIRTTLSPRALLERLQAIELHHGRLRGPERDAPRTLDLDILWIEGERIEEPGLEVPHPRLAERAFALIPLLEVAREAREPLTGIPYSEALAVVDTSGVVRLD